MEQKTKSKGLHVAGPYRGLHFLSQKRWLTITASHLTKLNKYFMNFIPVITIQERWRRSKLRYECRFCHPR